MAESSNAETMIEQVLRENIAASLDAALLSNAAAVAGLRPPGLFNGIAPITAAAAGANAMVKDLAALAGAIKTVAGASEPILLAAAPQAVAMRATLVEHPPIFASSALADGTVAICVPDALATIVEPPRIETGKEMTLHMEAATPAELVTSPGVVASPQRSIIQTDSTAIRLVLPLSWALRSSSAVAIITGCNWP
jgi:hypothetical protein